MEKKPAVWKAVRIREEEYLRLLEISEFQRRKMVKIVSVFINDYYKENEKEIKDFLKTA